MFQKVSGARQLSSELLVITGILTEPADDGETASLGHSLLGQVLEASPHSKAPRHGESSRFGPRRVKFTFLLGDFPSLWLWAIYLTSPHVRFLDGANTHHVEPP